MIFLRKYLLPLCLVFLLPGCASLSSVKSPYQHTSSELDLSSPSTAKTKNEAYLDFYSLLTGDLRAEVEYFNGSSNIGVQSLSSHVFVPENPVGTIFILHGYFDHVGSLSHMINFALENNYTVFAYDLLGHGMSSGNRGDTGGFNENALLLNNIVTKYANTLPKPYHLIGFSTGGSIALENAGLKGNSPFEKTILVSPLIRHTKWRLGRTAYTLFGSLLKTVKSRNKKNSMNTQYLEFAKNDPLRHTVVSFEFLKALYQWNRNYKKSIAIESDILVVQGELDSVVDWQYNLPLLEEKAKKIQIHKVPNGKHQLFNELEIVRNDVFETIISHLRR